MNPTSTHFREGFKSFFVLLVFLCVGVIVSRAQGLSPSSTVPANGASISSLSEIRIAFEGAYSISKEDAIGSATITCDGVTTPLLLEDIPDSDSEQGVIILQLITPITTPGSYTVTFPEGSFFVLFAGKPSAEIVINFTIVEGGEGPSQPGGEEPSGVKPSDIDPADGAELDVLQSVTLTWDYLKCTSGEGVATIEFNGETKTIDTSMVMFKNGSSSVWTGESTPATTTFPLNYTEAGEYTLRIPAGYVKLANSSMGPTESSAELVLHYTVKGGEMQAPDYTATPESGSQLKKLSEIKVQWGSSMLTKNSGEVTLKIDDKDPVDITEFCDFYAGSEPMWGGLIPGNAGNVSINFDPAYTVPGTYVITIPAGYVTVKDASAPNGEIVLTYEITGGAFEEPVPTIDPENKSELEMIDIITIDWGVPISEGNNMGTFSSTITVLKDGEYYYCDPYGEVEDDKVVIYFDSEITEAGEYEIIIPEDYVIFSDADESNTSFSIFYTIKEEGDDPEHPVDPDPTPEFRYEPEAGTTPMEALPEAVWIYFGDRTESLMIQNGKKITMTMGEEEYDLTEKVTADYDEEGEGWDLEFLYYAEIDLSDYTELTGNCTITVPEGFFNIGGTEILGHVYGGEDSPEVVITYIVDTAEAVHGVCPDTDGIFRIYTIDGVQVLSTENALDINCLGKGLYIVNGKKLIIR